MKKIIKLLWIIAIFCSLTSVAYAEDNILQNDIR